MNIENICCFFGHRKIANSDELEQAIYNTAEKLITTENVTRFLFGSKSGTKIAYDYAIKKSKTIINLA